MSLWFDISEDDHNHIESKDQNEDDDIVDDDAVNDEDNENESVSLVLNICNSFLLLLKTGDSKQQKIVNWGLEEEDDIFQLALNRFNFLWNEFVAKSGVLPH